MRARDLMSQPVTTCDVNDTLNVAAGRMWDEDCGAIVAVRDDGKLAGMLTDRDICMAAYTQGRPLDEILVNTAMSRHVVSVHPDQPLHEIESAMAHYQLRRLPVVDADNRPIGVISLNDLAIEGVQPDSGIKNSGATISHVLAAICRPRSSRRKAA